MVTIMSGLAASAGFNFENNGVSGIVLHDPYFPGTAYDQIRRCAEAAGIAWSVDDGVLVICPPDGNRGGVVSITPANGMVGYPSTFRGGIALTCLYNGLIKMLGVVDVTTSNTPAQGKWMVNQISHALESETPDGAWFTSIQCVQLGAGT